MTPGDTGMPGEGVGSEKDEGVAEGDGSVAKKPGAGDPSGLLELLEFFDPTDPGREFLSFPSSAPLASFVLCATTSFRRFEYGFST